MSLNDPGFCFGILFRPLSRVGATTDKLLKTEILWTTKFPAAVDRLLGKDRERPGFDLWVAFRKTAKRVSVVLPANWSVQDLLPGSAHSG